jgi:hypothetical protein
MQRGPRPFDVTVNVRRTNVHMHLKMSGPLASLILKSVGDRQPEIDSLTSALVRRAEGTAA